MIHFVLVLFGAFKICKRIDTRNVIKEFILITSWVLHQNFIGLIGHRFRDHIYVDEFVKSNHYIHGRISQMCGYALSLKTLSGTIQIETKYVIMYTFMHTQQSSTNTLLSHCQSAVTAASRNGQFSYLKVNTTQLIGVHYGSRFKY